MSLNSFPLPHDYEIPTFNYPEYVLPPVPYNYKPYTKDIWDANTAQPLKTKIIAPAQCKKGNIIENVWLNLFDDTAEYKVYYEIEIELKQIDPTIQSISKFQDSYKTIEISNLNNLQVECSDPKIQWFIPNRGVNLLTGRSGCTYDLGSLNNMTLYKNCLYQTDNVNFDNTITLYTDNITNEIKTFVTVYTSGLPSGDYSNSYITEKKIGNIKFLLQITKLFNDDNKKIKETYLQAYYTNELKLKIRFSKMIFIKLLGELSYAQNYPYFGNNENITIDVNNWGTLGIKNNSNSPVKITIKPR